MVAAPYSASLSLSVSAVPALPSTTAAGSPSARAAVSSSYVTFLGAPPACSTRTSTSAMSACRPFSSLWSDELLAREELGDLHAAVTLVLAPLAGLPRRARRERHDLAGRPGQPDRACLDTLEVGQGERGDRVLLGGHDALERRVPGLVDLLDHRDDGGQAALDHVVPVLGLPLDRHRAAVDGDLAGAGQLRRAEPLREQRGHHAHPGVGGLRRADDQVPLDSAQCGGEYGGGGEHVGAA